MQNQKPTQNLQKQGVFPDHNDRPFSGEIVPLNGEHNENAFLAQYGQARMLHAAMDKDALGRLNTMHLATHSKHYLQRRLSEEGFTELQMAGLDQDSTSTYYEQYRQFMLLEEHHEQRQESKERSAKQMSQMLETSKPINLYRDPTYYSDRLQKDFHEMNKDMAQSADGADKTTYDLAIKRGDREAAVEAQLRIMQRNQNLSKEGQEISEKDMAREQRDSGIPTGILMEGSKEGSQFVSTFGNDKSEVEMRREAEMMTDNALLGRDGFKEKYDFDYNEYSLAGDDRKQELMNQYDTKNGTYFANKSKEMGELMKEPLFESKEFSLSNENTTPGLGHDPNWKSPLSLTTKTETTTIETTVSSPATPSGP